MAETMSDVVARCLINLESDFVLFYSKITSTVSARVRKEY
jgi:hypothetical protein